MTSCSVSNASDDTSCRARRSCRESFTCATRRKVQPYRKLSSSSLELNMIPPAIEWLGSYRNMTCCQHPCFQKDRSLTHRRAISAVVKRP
jgi:hypothetical protein